jgi:glutaredoxin
VNRVEEEFRRKGNMATKKKIEIFSAGCSTCKETIELVKRIAGSSHEVVVHDMQRPEFASKAKQSGVRSVPAVVIDGKLAGCCAGRGPDEHVLRSALN